MGQQMQNKLKQAEGEHILKLSKYSANEEDRFSNPASETAKPDSHAAKKPDDRGKLGISNLRPIREADASEDENGNAANAPVFAWLKAIEDAAGDYPSSSAAEGFHKKYGEAPPFMNSYWGGGSKTGGEGEDSAAERSLARRLAAKFGDPVQSPPETLTSALKPYIAAAGFFVAVTGIFAFYVMPSRHSAQATSAASALKAKPELATIETGAPVAKVPASTANDIAARKASTQRIKMNAGAPRSGAALPTVGSVSAEERGWIPMQAETQSIAPQAGPPPSAEAATWSNALENLKEFVGQKPKTQEGNRESQRYLDALEAWQNAKKAP